MSTTVDLTTFNAGLAGWTPYTSPFGGTDVYAAAEPADGSLFDGSSDPGCVAMNAIDPLFGGDGLSLSQLTQDAGPTWEDRGVPAGATINSVTARLRFKKLSLPATDCTAIWFGLYLFGVSLYSLIGTNPTNDPLGLNLFATADDTWITVAGTSQSLGAGQLSTASSRLQLRIDCDNGYADHRAYIRVDSIELTIDYTPAVVCTITIDPASTTLEAGASSPFTASEASDFTITEAGGGTLSAASGTGTVYTAPVTPGTYHLVATSQAQTSCTATATITVPAAGARRRIVYERMLDGRQYETQQDRIAYERGLDRIQYETEEEHL